MTTDLQMLVYACLLMIAQSMSLLAASLQAKGAVPGLVWGLGNRADAPALPAWGERAVRAHKNMMENLIPFAALVLAAHAAGVAGEETARGATLFFWARLAFAVLYLGGVPYLRTVAFVVAIAGMFDIALQLLA
jgi:uncharacterized MAPEG superfamily protein